MAGQEQRILPRAPIALRCMTRSTGQRDDLTGALREGSCSLSSAWAITRLRLVWRILVIIDFVALITDIALDSPIRLTNRGREGESLAGLTDLTQ